MQILQSPTTNVLYKTDQMLNSTPSNDNKRHSAMTSVGSGRGIFNGYNFPNGVASPMISPTYKPNFGMSNASSLQFQSMKDGAINTLQENSATLKNGSYSATFNTQRRSLDRRILTETEDGQRSREMSLTRGGRESHSSDLGDFRRFNGDKSLERASNEY